MPRKSVYLVGIICLLNAHCYCQTKKTITKPVADYAKISALLDSVLVDDQKYRMQIDSVDSAFGGASPQMQELSINMNRADSINLGRIKHVLNVYGWPGISKVGESGNEAIFLVIQHADIVTQKKYLPLLRKTVREKDGMPMCLAMLEDRIATTEGRPQIYGTQVRCYNGNCVVCLIGDPDKVDERRKAVGLEPIADYLKQYGIVWDLPESKRNNPESVPRKKE